MNNLVTKIIIADKPDVLLAKVFFEISEGWDLYSPMIVKAGQIGQFMSHSKALYEYTLVDAQDLDDLSKKVGDLNDQGFDFLWHVTHWNGRLLQWMTRMMEPGEIAAKRSAHIMQAETITFPPKYNFELGGGRAFFMTTS